MFFKRNSEAQKQNIGMLSKKTVNGLLQSEAVEGT